MNQLLDLRVECTPLPSSSEVAHSQSDGMANVTLRCDALNLKYEGEILRAPLTKNERDDLRWYLEEYWKWPYEGFALRGANLERLLPELGQRLYQALFGQPTTQSLLQEWRANTTSDHQISIVSTDAQVLSLPWELLHDGQDFFVLQTHPPISIIRRIAEDEQQSNQSTLPNNFSRPLRVLLVTARPVDEGYVDAHTIARELVEALRDQVEAGTIELEFLRPPTIDALQERLSDKKHPVHVLHFDGHGNFGQNIGDKGEAKGRLYFEDKRGRVERVEASFFAEVLHSGGVRLAVLNACQSAVMGERDVFSSVAAQLIQSGMDAVVAMSANVLVVSASHYVKAFYSAVATGVSVQTAHEQAQQVLQKDPLRHPLQRYLDDAGTPVKLYDWWLPHFYQRSAFSLQPVKSGTKHKKTRPSTQCLNDKMPVAPRYSFSGRSYELLQIERALLQKKVEAISGFGGVGKTALVREAADWMTQSKMYDGACFVSFEHGGDAPLLLSAVGDFLAINDGNYRPHDPDAALATLGSVLKKKRLLCIADNLESILPGGDASLDETARTKLWDVLLALAEMGAGVLLTSRNVTFGDERFTEGGRVTSLVLRGLNSEDAYALATRVLSKLEIDRARFPYLELHDLLARLDYHPLAIQLVLPALRELPLATLKADFTVLLPRFADDEEKGHNRTLQASLNYSLQRLSAEQRALLPQLAAFEGGALDHDVLNVTSIPKEAWDTLRQALEAAALLTPEPIHESMSARFHHFHPVLTPFLRGLPEAEDEVLYQRYTEYYQQLAYFLNRRDNDNPERIRAWTRCELPNLRHALNILLKGREIELITALADHLTSFLEYFGLWRERDAVQQRVIEAIHPANHQDNPGTETLAWAQYWCEKSLGDQELAKGNWRTASNRFSALLSGIEASSEGEQLGRNSVEHLIVLQYLARCLKEGGQLEEALKRQREALAVLDILLAKEPENQDFVRFRGSLLTDSGDVLRYKGQYVQAKEAYEEALQIARRQKNVRSQAVALAQLGAVALKQEDYLDAREKYIEARRLFHDLGEPAMEGVACHQLGLLTAERGADFNRQRLISVKNNTLPIMDEAEERKAWAEAESYYRESLKIREQLSDNTAAAGTCNQLAILTGRSGRMKETEGWYRRALELIDKDSPDSPAYVSCLANLADFLTSETNPERLAHLAEAKGYVERALKMAERLDTTAESWTVLRTLGKIADMEGQPEKAQDYRRREHESFASFAGHQELVDRKFGQLIANVVAAAKGDMQARAQAEIVLAYFDADTNMRSVATAIRAIWAGEQDWHTLTKDVDTYNALTVLRILETIAH